MELINLYVKLESLNFILVLAICLLMLATIGMYYLLIKFYLIINARIRTNKLKKLNHEKVNKRK